jgi:hypothetical protein
MNEKQAAKQAAKQSKSGTLAYVVYVYDQGRSVFNAEQFKTYQQFCDLEAVYKNGKVVAAE